MSRHKETRMTICYYVNVIFFTKNGIKYAKQNDFVFIILCNYSCNACFLLIFYCKLKLKFFSKTYARSFISNKSNQKY